MSAVLERRAKNLCWCRVATVASLSSSVLSLSLQLPHHELLEHMKRYSDTPPISYFAVPPSWAGGGSSLVDGIGPVSPHAAGTTEGRYSRWLHTVIQHYAYDNDVCHSSERLEERE